MDTSALQEAIDIAGGQLHLARLISSEPGKVKQGHVWGWLNLPRPVPPEHCVVIEEKTGVTVERLRPDLVWVRRAGKPVSYQVDIEPSGSAKPKRKKAA